MRQRVLIIGGGIGGLAIALRLAARNYQVMILEQNERVGGRINRSQAEGFTFDTGPTSLTHLHLWEELFATANQTWESLGLKLQRIEPQLRAFYGDGDFFDLGSDLPHLLANIEKIHPNQKRSFFEYLQYAEEVYPHFQKHYSPSKKKAMLNRFKWSRNSLLGTHEQYLHNRQLIDLFNWSAKKGSRPAASAPALWTSLFYEQLGYGLYYLDGGIYHLIESLVQLLKKQGVEFCMNMKVDKILTSSFEATGVQLTDGSQLPANLVISNLSLPVTYHHLLRDSSILRKIKPRLAEIQPSLSTYVLLLGIHGTYRHLLQHNYYLSHQTADEEKQLFIEQVPPDDPTLYVHISAKSVPTHAPPGKENLMIMTHVPATDSHIDWVSFEPHFRHRVINKLEQMGLIDLRNRIIWQASYHPLQWEWRYGLYHGGIYGITVPDPFPDPFPLQAPKLSNLYFVGSNNFIGGRIPSILEACQQLEKLIVAQNTS